MAKFCLECGTAMPSAPEGASQDAKAEGGAPPAADGESKPAVDISKPADAKKSVTESQAKGSQPVSASGSSASASPQPPQARKAVGSNIWLYLGLGCLGIIMLAGVFILGLIIVGKKIAADKSGRVTVTATPTSNGGQETPSAHPTEAVYSDNMTMCKSLKKNMGPDEVSTVFSPSETIYCSVDVKGIRMGKTVTARWYKGDTFIKEYPCTINIPNAAYIGFSLKPKTKWPAGDDYRVEVFISGKSIGEATFKVEEGGGSSSTETEMDPALKECIRSATLCKGVDDEYKPIDETEVFGSSDTFNCVVVLENAPAGTTVKAKWYHGEEMMKESEVPLKEGGAKTLNLYCRNKSGWTPGDYSVELSLNDHPVEVKNFTVSESENSEDSGEKE
jgi:hypothetical protein